MTIENKDNEIIIRISADVNLDDIQKSLDFIEFKEITAKSKATQDDVDKLAEFSKQSWWEKNGAKYFPNAK